MPEAARSAQPHPYASGSAAANLKSTPKLYNPRHPDCTLLYPTIAEHFKTGHERASAGQFDGQGDHHLSKVFVSQAFREYLEYGIFAHGFACARCGDCGHDYFVAFSCKGRGVCPSFNTRRMVEPAAHLTNQSHAIGPLRLHIPDRSKAVWKPKTCDILTPMWLNFQSALGFHSAVQSVAGVAPRSRRCQCSIRQVRSSARVLAAYMPTCT